MLYTLEDLKKENLDYHTMEGMNQSRLKHIFRNPILIKLQQEKDLATEASHFRHGGALDCLLTQPSKFREHFYVGDITIPSVAEVAEFLKNHVHLADTFDLSNHEDEVLQNIILTSLESAGLYQNNWKPFTKVQKILSEENVKYIQALREMEGRHLLSTTEEEFVKKQAVALQYVVGKQFDSMNGWENLGKVVIQVEIDGVLYKCEIDRLYRRKRKLDGLYEYAIIDFKTMADAPVYFESNFYRFNYGFQAAFYKFLLAHDLHMFGDIQFYFGVISSDEEHLENYGAMCVRLQDVIVDAYTYGTILKNGKKIYGVMEAIDLYNYWLKSPHKYPWYYEEEGVLIETDLYIKED